MEPQIPSRGILHFCIADKFVMALLAIAMLITVAPIALAQTTVYAITNAGEFGTLNLSSGVFTEIGTTGATLAGLGAFGGEVYGGTYHTSTLDRVNISNGNLTSIGMASISYRDFGSTTSSLYGTDGNLNLYSISAGNGSATLIGAMGFTSCPDTSLSSGGGALYFACGSILYSVSTTSGAATMIGDTSVGNIDSMIVASGVLYANTSAGALYTLNITNGIATFVANSGVDLWGVAFPATTFTIIHNFTGHGDGGNPFAGVTLDQAGNLYGTTQTGGNSNAGVVYKLAFKHTSWVLSPLYTFSGVPDGGEPYAGITRDAHGQLYGTTSSGGQGTCVLFGIQGCGIVFKLAPSSQVQRSVIAPWVKTLLYSFSGTADGGNPGIGNAVFDLAGNLYDTTRKDGTGDCGTVYELTPAIPPPWTPTILYSFTGQNGDGCLPLAGVTVDSAGNLYGTANLNGTFGYGMAYQLVPSESGWTENILHQFQDSNDGGYPSAGLIPDGAGNLFGATQTGGSNGGGTVYELSPSDGGWNFTVLYSFSGSVGSGPANNLAMDGAGNLYGTTQGNPGADDYGTVFELIKAANTWTYSLLHTFSVSDGESPYGMLTIDGSGNVFGTTYAGGSTGGCEGGGTCGVVFELTP